MFLCLSACTVNEEQSSNDTENYPSQIGFSYQMGTTDVSDYDEKLPHYYTIDIEEKTVQTEFLRESEEESFSHEAELLDYSQIEGTFTFTYVEHFDEEVTKTFEILSESIAKDTDNNLRYTWGQNFE